MGYSFDAIHEPTGASDAYDQFVTSNRQNDIMFYRQDNPVAYIGKAGTLFECYIFTNDSLCGQMFDLFQVGVNGW